ncbi:flagellar biosynthetic protein FliO [Castellaniella hirudinis]|uniref:flagellar biosynthetic protein FliO n=1 Tax=Castellaniella hirudinis TaxID=1144617 RepID=UPI0039C449F7
MDQAQTLRVIGALLFVLVLMLALAWIARRGGWLRQPGQSRLLQVLATRSLGARCHVAIVQVDDARLVLGVTPQSISLLHTLPDTVPPPSDAGGDFAAVLDKSRSRP